MATLQLGEEDGFITIAIGGNEKLYDLYELNNRLYEWYSELNGEGKTRQLHERVKEWLLEEGFGSVSHRTADRVVAGVFARVDELKKKDSPPTFSDDTESNDTGESQSAA
jgi:hypothetical protein